MRLLSLNSPLVIGHRGAAAVRPENTLPSVAHAMALGVDAVEFDVRVSLDGVAVVHHDASTARTCGDALEIEQSPVAALRALDANAVKRAAGVTGAVRIPSLDEMLEVTGTLPIIIECKTVAAAPAVLTALRRHNAQGRAIIGSFIHEAMQVVRAAGLPSGASRRDMVALYARSLVRLTPSRLPYAAMCLPEEFGRLTLPIGRFAAWGRALGVPVHVWTVNDPASATRLWRLGVTGILTDDPATILRARADLDG